MNEDELPLINGTIKRTAAGSNSLPSGIDINKINLLQNGQELFFDGTKVECMKAPCHTNGSMVYMVDGKYLFTGDAFKVKKGTVTVHPYTMNAELAKKTIEQLKETIKSSSIVLTAHYGYFERLN